MTTTVTKELAQVQITIYPTGYNLRETIFIDECTRTYRDMKTGKLVDIDDHTQDKGNEGLFFVSDICSIHIQHITNGECSDRWLDEWLWGQIEDYDDAQLIINMAKRFIPQPFYRNGSALQLFLILVYHVEQDYTPASWIGGEEYDYSLELIGYLNANTMDIVPVSKE